MPKYTNKFYYLTVPDVTQSDYSFFLVLCYLYDFLLIISWFILSFYNNPGLTNISLDPEDELKSLKGKTQN